MYIVLVDNTSEHIVRLHRKHTTNKPLGDHPKRKKVPDIQKLNNIKLCIKNLLSNKIKIFNLNQ